MDDGEIQLTAQDLGIQLMDARVRRDMTFKSVAKLAGCSPQSIINAENGSMSVGMMLKICEALGLQLEINDPMLRRMERMAAKGKKR